MTCSTQLAPFVYINNKPIVTTPEGGKFIPKPFTKSSLHLSFLLNLIACSEEPNRSTKTRAPLLQQPPPSTLPSICSILVEVDVFGSSQALIHLGLWVRMEPSRGLKRKRKRKRKAEAKVEENGLATSPLSQPLPLDWWDDFSKRITGMCICICFIIS